MRRPAWSTTVQHVTIKNAQTCLKHYHSACHHKNRINSGTYSGHTHHHGTWRLVRSWFDCLHDSGACLKNHFRQLYFPLCIRFVPNAGYIALYPPFICRKSAKYGETHLSESIFKTLSRDRSLQIDQHNFL